MNNSVNVLVGDIVLVKLPFPKDSQRRKAIILKVERRYARLNQGSVRQQPLLEARFMDDNETKHFDQSFVLEVLQKSKKVQPVVNIYRRNTRPQFVTVCGSNWAGYLEDLVEFALSRLPYRIDRPVDVILLHTLYDRQQEGCLKRISTGSGYFGPLRYTVNRHRFEKWVRKNYNRICKSTAQLVTEATHKQRAYENDYWASVEDDMDRELDPDSAFEDRQTQLDAYPV